MRRIHLLRSQCITFRRRDLHDDVFFDRDGKKLIDLRTCRIIRYNNALHRTGRTNLARNSPGIDMIQAGNPLLCKKISQTRLIMPVAALLTKLSYDEPIDKGFSRLHE